MTSLFKKTKNIKVRLSEEEYMRYLCLFENAKIGRDKKYTISDFIRDCIFNKEVKNIKTVRVKAPSPCKKQRLQMLISTVNNIESIGKSLLFHRKNHNFNLNKYLLKIEEIENSLKMNLC